jgi:SAM-dependent methyltransferase
MKRILNVGCGDEVYGTDFVDFYPRRPEVKQCDLDGGRLPYANGTFDTVYSQNLFEHLQNPGRTLKEMLRVLKSGGKLILITDNASYWLFHIKRFSAHYENYKAHGADDRHYSLYTTWHLENFIETSSAKIKNMRLITRCETSKGTLDILKHPQKNSKLYVINKLISLLPFVGHMAYPRIFVEAEKI